MFPIQKKEHESRVMTALNPLALTIQSLKGFMLKSPTMTGKLRSKPRRGGMFVAPAGPKPRHKPRRGGMFVAPAGPKPICIKLRLPGGVCKAKIAGRGLQS